MQIFEYPYIIITILLFLLVVSGAVGVYFAICGIKAAKETEEIDFVTISKLENTYEKFLKSKTRCFAVYIGISLDNARSVYSEAAARQISESIKPILLKTFMSDEDSFIAPCDNQNFVALGAVLPTNNAQAEINSCIRQIDDCLVKYKAINLVDIKFGIYEGASTDVTFDEAVSRAKTAFSIAENDNIPFAVWSTHSGRQAQQRIKIENNIENEIDNNRFFLEYQPILFADTKKIAGAEVLSRLNSESDGILTPGSFLSAVNAVGIAKKFDYYIFEKNCKWIANNKAAREKYVYTTNFSRSTLCEADFAETIISIVEKYGLSFSCIAVEILEDKSVSEKERNNMNENLKILKEKGVLLLLDDFGSGYTTFVDLHDFKIDIVKIDKKLTQNALNDAGFVILKNVVTTARELGFKTLCEGIETKEHEEKAIMAGGEMLQGYYYYRPMPVAKLEQLFDEEK